MKVTAKDVSHVANLANLEREGVRDRIRELEEHLKFLDEPCDALPTPEASNHNADRRAAVSLRR